MAEAKPYVNYHLKRVQTLAITMRLETAEIVAQIASERWAAAVESKDLAEQNRWGHVLHEISMAWSGTLNTVKEMREATAAFDRQYPGLVGLNRATGKR